MRDADFVELTKRTLAQRVGYRCSNPQCGALTSGPQINPSKSLNIGVAAHIIAAASGGPRYSQTLSTKDRLSVENGIWLCQSCAKLIDNDASRFTANTLKDWKETAEAEAFSSIGKTNPKDDGVAVGGPHHIRFEEDLELETNARFGFSFLYPKNWDRRDPENGDGNIYTHPKDIGVEMRAWGSHAVVSPTLGQWVDWTLHIEKKSGFRVLRDTESGRHAYHLKEGEATSREQIRGRRIVFEHEESGERVLVMWVLTQLENIQFAIRCRAPARSYPHYEDLFIVLGQSLRVISEHPDVRSPMPTLRQEAQQAVVLCPACGKEPGTPNACCGGRHHEFSRFPGPADLTVLSQMWKTA